MLQKWKRWIFLIIMLLGGAATAQEVSLGLSIYRQDRQVTALNLEWSSKTTREYDAYQSSTGPCAGTATVIYTHAVHPESSGRRYLNEKNDGYGGRCYFTRKKTCYLLVGGLVNSQYGNTALFGPGCKFRLIEAWGVSLDVGGEAPIVYYELRGNRGSVTGILPVPYLSVNYRIGDFGEVGLMQMRLPKGGITLGATVIDTSPMSAARGYSSPLPPLTQDGSNGQSTIFVRIVF